MSLADYISNKPKVHTERLCIRPMSAKDIPSLKEWMPDKSIYTYWGKGPGKTDKNPELLFEKTEKLTKSFHLGIEETVYQSTIQSLQDIVHLLPRHFWQELISYQSSCPTFVIR